MAECGRKRTVATAVWALFLIAGHPAPSHAEWYAAGYGGLSLAGSISKAEMPLLGDARALQVFRIGSVDPSATPNPALGDVLLKNVQSSDISLRQSPIFGAKVDISSTSRASPGRESRSKPLPLNPISSSGRSLRPRPRPPFAVRSPLRIRWNESS